MKTLKQIFLISIGALAIAVFAVGEHQRVYAYHNSFFLDASAIVSGILNNFRLDPSSVTKLGPSINGATGEIDDNSIIGRNIALNAVVSTHIADNTISGRNIAANTILSTHVAFNTGGTAVPPRLYWATISTDATVGNPDSYGADRIPFLNAIASVTVGIKAQIFVRRGTYTIENVVSDGIEWVCERGVVFRRANNNMMFRLSNGGIVGGVFITTAVGGTVITTNCIVLGNGGYLKNVAFELAQDNSANADFQDFLSGYIQITTATALIDGIVVSSYTNNGNTGARNKFIACWRSTVTIQNSIITGEFRNSANLDALIGFRNSFMTIQNNIISSTGVGAGILANDNAGDNSFYTITGNIFRINAALAVSNAGIIYDGSFSTGSLIANNTFLCYNTNCGAIHILGGGLGGVAQYSAKAVRIVNNLYTYAPELLKDQANYTTLGTFCILRSGANSFIRDTFLHGNVLGQSGTFVTESGAVTNTIFKDNRNGSASVTDQN